MNSNKLLILVTRPPPAGLELCQAIEQVGDEAIHFPTIAFKSRTHEVDFLQSLKELGECDWLIFISPQSVYESIPAIRKTWPIFPPHTQFAAIGKGTAQALKAAGYHALFPLTEWNSEGLLALPEFQSVARKKIVIFKGEGGRDHLEKSLAERGASVKSLIAYQRILPTLQIEPFLSLFEEHRIDVIVATSCESIQNLKTLFLKIFNDYLKFVPLIVVSERIKTLARDLGFQTIWMAKNASHQAILDAITQKKGELCQMKQHNQ